MYSSWTFGFKFAKQRLPFVCQFNTYSDRSKMRGRLLSVAVLALASVASARWAHCSSTSKACCNPTSSPSQICPNGSKCQSCGGAASCECPQASPPPPPPADSRRRASPTPPSPSTICDSVHNMKCQGNTLKVVGPFNSHQECCSACTALAGCHAWSWDWQDVVGANCYLKSSCSNKLASAQYHSGYSTTPAPGPTPTPPPPGPSPLGPDVNLILENKCPYPVRFFWDSNIGGAPPNVAILYNEKLAAHSSDVIRVDNAKEASGRIYVQSSDDSDGGTLNPGLPRANLQDALNLLWLNDGFNFRARYAQHLMAGEPRVSKGGLPPPGQLIEFTITHDRSTNERIYDADISNVFNFNGAVSVDMLYPNGGKIDTENCRNTSMTEQPDKERCEEAGAVWYPYQSAKYGPKGLCSSPNIVCINLHGSLPICKKFDAELYLLFKFLNTYKAQVGYEPKLSSSLANTARMYSCDGFMDNADTGFFLASMCSSLNRGQCPMPSTAELQSIPAFKKYVETKCGRSQFYREGESTWFTHPVRNPWAEYIRKTLGSNGYSFAQDEGPYGGNAQCRALAIHQWEAPSGMQVTACPGGSPAPGPAPAPAHGSCNVGDHVYCPGETSYRCAGNSCCQDGSTCPSADNTFRGCQKTKAFDCTTASVPDVVVV